LSIRVVIKKGIETEIRIETGIETEIGIGRVDKMIIILPKCFRSHVIAL
jgi:hypothetical protein